MKELRPCGTHAAARRHRRRGEPLCQACREAVDDYTRARREARRAEWVASIEERLVWADPAFIASDENATPASIRARLVRAGRPDLADQFLPLMSQRQIERMRRAA